MNIIHDIKTNKGFYTTADVNNIQIGHKLEYIDKTNNVSIEGTVCSIEHEINDNDDHLILIKIY